MKINVGVFFGGNSVEHEVSIITAIQAIENIDKEKYNVIPIYISKENKLYCGNKIGDIENYRDIPKLISDSFEITLMQKDKRVALYKINYKIFSKRIFDYIDVAFPIVHGTNVEDGTIQGYLKMFNIPFVGCEVMASSLGMDKYYFKCVMKENNIPVLDALKVNDYEYEESENKVLKNIQDKFEFPVIIKPINLGSSVGIKIAKNKKELKEAIENAFEFSNKILIEKAIKNMKEVNCSVLGSAAECRASECEEPVKSDEILSYKDKYISGEKGGSKSMNAGCLKLPADITKEQRKEIQRLSIETFKALECNGVVRIDYIIDQDDGIIYVNEINTIPGSLSFHLWKATKKPYNELLDKLIELALEKKRMEDARTFSYDTNILSGVTLSGLKGLKNK